MLQEVEVSALSDNQRALWLKAESALEMKNYSYAISLAQTLLEQLPGFLDARKLARKAAIGKNKGKKVKKGLFGGSYLSLGKATSLGKKDPALALIELEKQLEKSPFDSHANNLLFDCALHLNLLDTAAFGLETVRSGSSENTKLLHKLAEHYLVRDLPDKAAGVYQDIVRQDPNDIDAIKGEKDATARASMKKQKWEEAQSFRDVMKDSDEALKLEAANRAAMTRDQLEAKLVTLSERYAENAQDLATVKEIASLYEQLEDWSESYTFFEYAYRLSHGDIALQNKADSMKQKVVEQELESLKQACEQNPQDEELAHRYEALKSERSEERIAQAQKRVNNNPTDPQLRYELGKALYHAGKFSQAISHLQQATRNPHIRTRVLLLLGRTFRAKNMHDLAIKQLGDALADLQSMDGTKKEVLYEKGLIHMDMGDKESALDCFKQIYEVDYSYRDVAQRVEASYAS